MLQIVAAFFGIGGTIASGLIADRLGRRNTVAIFAAAIAAFSGFVPQLLNGGNVGHAVFIVVGFTLLGLSYGQVAGARRRELRAAVPLHRRRADLGLSPGSSAPVSRRWPRWACRRTSAWVT